MNSLRLRDVFLVLFNLLPLALVLDGRWRPFDVMAFYWLELIAAGFFATLATVIAALYKLTHGKTAAGLGEGLSLLFFPLHFGFFIVMMAFMVGSFLPEDTPARPLAHPLVPSVVVIENMPFFTMLPLVMCWQFFEFMHGFIAPRGYAAEEAGTFSTPYKKLFILFIAAFAGIAVAMQSGSLLWGAGFLCVLKTLAAYTEAHMRRREKAVETADQPTDAPPAQE